MSLSDWALYVWKTLLISPYCKIQKCGRGTLKVFVWVEHTWSLTSTPRFRKVAMARLVSPYVSALTSAESVPGENWGLVDLPSIPGCSPRGPNVHDTKAAHQRSTCTAAMTSARCTYRASAGSVYNTCLYFCPGNPRLKCGSPTYDKIPVFPEFISNLIQMLWQHSSACRCAVQNFK